jgi:hypothetical protein
MTLKIDEDRLTVVSEQAGGNQRVTITAEADYAINKESTLYGVITSVDVDGTIPEKDLLTYEQAGIGQPFAVRFRLDGDSLTLKDFRGFGIGVDSHNNDLAAQVAIFLGRYAKADGKAPAKPAPRRLRGTTGRSDVPPAPVPGTPYLPAGPSSSSQLPVRPPVRGVAAGPDAIEPPSDRDVLSELPRPAGPFRDDIVIVKDRIASKSAGPRFYPCVGPARLNRSQWECKVYFTETGKPRVQTVYLDTEQLVLAK